MTQHGDSGVRTGLWITNTIKLAGVVVAVNEALVEPTLRPGAIALAALMLAGAQSLESFITAFFGSQQATKDKP